MPHSAMLAVSISVEVALVTAVAVMGLAARARSGGSPDRDRVVTILSCAAVALILFTGSVPLLVSALGFGLPGVLKAACLLMGAFAVAGMGFGLAAGLRSGRGAKQRIA